MVLFPFTSTTGVRTGDIPVPGTGGATINDFIRSAVELVSAQGPLQFKESISKQTGEKLVELGLAQSVDDGIVTFHEFLRESHPSTYRVLHKGDKARRPQAVRRVLGQRMKPTASARAVQAGMLRRDKRGRLQKLTKADKLRIARSKGLSQRTKDILLGRKPKAKARR